MNSEKKKEIFSLSLSPFSFRPGGLSLGASTVGPALALHAPSGPAEAAAHTSARPSNPVASGLSAFRSRRPYIRAAATPSRSLSISELLLPSSHRATASSRAIAAVADIGFRRLPLLRLRDYLAERLREVRSYGYRSLPLPTAQSSVPRRRCFPRRAEPPLRCSRCLSPVAAIPKAPIKFERSSYVSPCYFRAVFWPVGPVPRAPTSFPPTIMEDHRHRYCSQSPAFSLSLPLFLGRPSQDQRPIMADTPSVLNLLKSPPSIY